MVRPVLFLVCLAAAWPQALFAQNPSEVRAPARRVQALSAAVTCTFAPDMTEAGGKRQCWQRGKAKLEDQAAAYVEAEAVRLGLGLSAEEIRAFAASLLTVRVVNEDVQKSDAGLSVQLTLAADEDAHALAERLRAFAASPQLRAQAVGELRAAKSREAAPAPQAPTAWSDLEERARDVERDMRQTAAFAQKSIRGGMSYQEVVGLLGAPRTAKQGGEDENYACLGYGRIWVVFKNGLAACLRTELEYSRRHGSDCHCAGNFATITPLP